MHAFHGKYYTGRAFEVSLFGEKHAGNSIISAADQTCGVRLCQPIGDSGWDQNKHSGWPWGTLYRGCDKTLILQFHLKTWPPNGHIKNYQRYVNRTIIETPDLPLSYQILQSIVCLCNACAAERISLDDISSGQQVLLQTGIAEKTLVSLLKDKHCPAYMPAVLQEGLEEAHVNKGCFCCIRTATKRL